MLNSIYKSFSFALSLGKEFFRTIPVRSTILIFASLLSQLALVSSFLLPFKVIMLMSSNQMTFSLPLLDDFETRNLVIVFSSLSVLSYMYHLFSEQFIQKLTQSGADLLLSKRKKLSIFENQDFIAQQAYKRYIESSSSLLFSGLATMIIFYAYDEAVFTLIAFLIAAFLVIFLFWRLSEENAATINENLPKILNNIANLAFLAIFSWIIIDYLYFKKPSILALMITIIIGRQLLSRASIALINLYHINKQKEKISALFFHDQTFHPTNESMKAGIWTAVTQGALLDEAVKKLKETLDLPSNEKHTIQWMDSGLVNIFFYRVFFEEKKEAYLLKVFDRKKSLEATHEATLLLDPPAHLPAPKLVSTFIISGYHCHALCITNFEADDQLNLHNASTALKELLLGVEPSPELEAMYLKTHTPLWHRLSEAFFKKLSKADPNHNNAQPVVSEKEILSIQKLLHDSPKTITISGLTENTVVTSPGEGYACLHWGKWAIEPAGSGFPFILENNEKLHFIVENKLKEARQKREHLCNFMPQQYIACALCFRMEKEALKQQYDKAKQTMASITKMISLQSENPGS